MIGNHNDPSEYVGIVPEGGASYRMAFDTGGNETLHTLPEAMERVSRQPGIRVVCADAAQFARRAGSDVPDVSPIRMTLLRLAREGRLICLATARHVASTARHPQMRLPDDMSFDVLDDPAALACLGRRSIEFVTGPIWGKWLSAAAGVANPAGPLGLAVRIRAQVACGLVGSDGLQLDPRVLPTVLKELRTVADDAFRQLVGYSGAADCFKGGKKACPDNRGFRQTRTDSLKRWLGGVADAVLDRWGIPVPRPDRMDGWPDQQVRNWPVWSLGAEPLTQLWDLQAAEHLQHQFREAKETVTRTTYTTLPRLSAHRPDLFAYRRFRTADRMPPVFTPRDGYYFIRISMEDLPVRALAATLDRVRPGGRLVRELATPRRAGEVLAATLRDITSLTPTEAEFVTILTATGIGVPAIAALSEWQTGSVRPQSMFRAMDRQLRSAFPELDMYTADQVADLVANSMGTTADELRNWVGFDPTAAGRGEGFLRQFYASSLAERWRYMSWGERLEFTMRSRATSAPPRPPRELEPLDLNRLRAMINPSNDFLFEPTVTPTGRAYAGLRWVPARAAFLDAAQDACTEALFAVLAAGHQVSALGPLEFLLELEARDVERVADRVKEITERSAKFALGGYAVRVEVETLVRW